MPNQTQEVPRRPQLLNKEDSIRQRIWKLWLLIFAGVLTAAFTTSLTHAGELEDPQETRIHEH